MKKFSYLITFVLAMGIMVFFNACKKDEEEKPEENPAISISKPAANTAVEKGGKVDFEMLFAPNGTSNSNLTTLSVTKNDGSGASGWLIFDNNTKSDTTFKDPIKASLTFKRSYSFNLDTGKTYTFTFVIKDAAGKSASASVALKSKAAAVTPMTTTRTGQFWHIAGACKGAFDLVAGASKGSTDADADKDMKNTDAAASAFTGTWATGNSTMYVINNAYNYANANVQGAAEKYATGTAKSTITNPMQGDIYIAKLRGGTDYAVIKILTNDASVGFCADGTTPTTNKGKITFEYKTK